jgi:hypothetical protein
MRIAIVSDIHDNVWKLDRMLEAAREADALICCGDLCSPFIVHQMAHGFARAIHMVFGNNDGDRYRIGANAAVYPHVKVHGEMLRGEFGGKLVAATHYDFLARPMIASGEFDVVLFGHNHLYEVERVGKTLAINPGALMGATFSPDGTRSHVASTFVLHDTETDETARVEV